MITHIMKTHKNKIFGTLRNKNISMGKKAIFFSLVSLFAVMVFVVLFSSLTFQEKEQSGLEVTRTRITTSSSFVKDFEERYVERLLLVSSTKALQGLADKVADKTINPLTMAELEDIFKNIVQYDSTDGWDCKDDSPKNSDLGVMDKTNDDNYFTFPNPCGDRLLDFGIINTVNNIVSQLGLQFTTFKIKEITLDQDDPWKVKARFTLEYTIEEATGLASWRIEESIKEVEISIVGIKAPVDTSAPCCGDLGGGEIIDITWSSNSDYPNFLNRLIKEGTSSGTSGIKHNDESKP